MNIKKIGLTFLGLLFLLSISFLTIKAENIEENITLEYDTMYVSKENELIQEFVFKEDKTVLYNVYEEDDLANKITLTLKYEIVKNSETQEDEINIFFREELLGTFTFENVNHTMKEKEYIEEPITIPVIPTLKDLLGEEKYQFINYIITALVSVFSALAVILTFVGKLKNLVSANHKKVEEATKSAFDVANQTKELKEQNDTIQRELVISNEELSETNKKLNEELQSNKGKLEDLENSNKAILEILNIVYLNDSKLVSSGRAKEITKIVGKINGKKEDKKEN